MIKGTSEGNEGDAGLMEAHIAERDADDKVAREKLLVRSLQEAAKTLCDAADTLVDMRNQINELAADAATHEARAMQYSDAANAAEARMRNERAGRMAALEAYKNAENRIGVEHAEAAFANARAIDTTDEVIRLRAKLEVETAGRIEAMRVAHAVADEWIEKYDRELERADAAEKQRDEAILSRKALEALYHGHFVDMLGVLDPTWDPQDDEWSLDDIPALVRERCAELEAEGDRRRAAERREPVSEVEMLTSLLHGTADRRLVEGSKTAQWHDAYIEALGDLARLAGQREGNNG